MRHMLTSLSLRAILCLLLIGVGTLLVEPAAALPSFGKQTGQPCAACHVGAFGPQLKPYGRDFKLRGYVNGDGEDHGLPLTVTLNGSFTHLNPRSATSGESNNLAFGGGALYYAGKLAEKTGALVSVTYDAINRQLQLNRADVRHVREGRLFGEDVIYGLSLNNNPTSSDVWNSIPAWGYPFARSPQAPRAKAATLIDGRVRQRAFGTTAFMQWNNLAYFEFGAYEGLTPEMLNAVGKVPVAGADRYKTAMPYMRVALTQDWANTHAEVGTYGILAKVLPRGVSPLGQANEFSDLGIDGNFQYILDPSKVGSDMVSASATLIRETIDSRATAILSGSGSRQSLQTFRTNVSYSFAATWTPTIQYFRTTGNTDARYWGTPGGRPDSDGLIYELAYVPWGKPDAPAPIPGLNARLVAQFTNYFSFDGSRTNARRNNTLYLGAMTALAF